MLNAEVRSVQDATSEGPKKLAEIYKVWRDGCLCGKLAATKPISPNSVLPRVVMRPRAAVNYADPAKRAARDELISDLWHVKTTAPDDPMDTDPAPAPVGNIFQSAKKKAQLRKTRDPIAPHNRSAAVPASPAVSESSTFVEATEPIMNATSDMSDAPASSIGLIHTGAPPSEAPPSIPISSNSAGLTNTETLTPDVHVEMPAVAHSTSGKRIMYCP